MNNNYCLIGETLSHSMSAHIHTNLFELSKKVCNYQLYEIPKNDFEKLASYLKDNFDGFNVTIPYKEKIIPFLDSLDKSAEFYQSVNCVTKRNGLTIGYNTDAEGFLKSLSANNISLSTEVLLLGCGGTGRMMAYETIKAGGALTIATREKSIQKAMNVADEIKKVFPDGKILVADINNVKTEDTFTGKFDTILNATPVGMYPNTADCPLNERIITPILSDCTAVYDAIYNPADTILVQAAKNMGKKVVGGVAMLVYQAAASHKIWYNSLFDQTDLQNLIEKIEFTLQIKTCY